jgi:phosphotransferase system  glucose/maltose/N-acetylglucosamine-specific IIC component
MRTLCLTVAMLLPQVAHASYGGGGACQSVGCYFVMFGILVGVSGGIPASAVLFAVLCVVCRNPERTIAKQLVVGLFAGIAAFLLAALGASLMAVMKGNAAIGFLVPYAIMAGFVVRNARSEPRAGASVPR